MCSSYHQSKPKFLIFIFVGNTGDRTQGLVLARQVLYHLSHEPSAFAVYQIWSRASAQASLRLGCSYLHLPSSWNYRCAYKPNMFYTLWLLFLKKAGFLCHGR
jgi:hypothetical protein